MKRTRRVNNDAPNAQPAQPGRAKRPARAASRSTSDTPYIPKPPASARSKRARKLVKAISSAEPQAVPRAKVVRPGPARAERIFDEATPAFGQPHRRPRFTLNVRHLFAVLLGAMAVIGIIVVAVQNAPRWLAAAAATPTASAQQTASANATAGAVGWTNRVGIVSGHRGNDSGTVCQDGLTEAQVNFDHATRVAAFLRAEGYTVDVLDEFDMRLKGYRAAALLSIHADSCAYINDQATGFKVARALESRVPDAEDALVMCLTSRYKQATGLRFHASTVTFDMTKYHAFYEVDQNTPAAIIETGFLNRDRTLLTRKPEVVAQGITDGLLCFLRP